MYASEQEASSMPNSSYSYLGQAGVYYSSRWGYLVCFPESMGLDTEGSRLGRIASISAMGAMVLAVFWTNMALTKIVFKNIMNPLMTLSAGVHEIRDGNLTYRINYKNTDEFQPVCSDFNEMAEKLEKVDKTRQEFVSNVSHELKTPLSSIKVLSESIVLQEDVPVKMYKEFLQDINSEVDRMTSVVTDLLELVKLDQGELGLNTNSANINIMVSDILKRLSPLADNKGIQFVLEDVREVIIEADEMKLSSAISNLVDNAIKYTHSNGTVKIIVDADHQNAFISITDTGIGISEDDQSKIFDRFYRVDKTRDRETGGTGLGLAITYATVRLHNGSIRVSSKENEGTTFILRIPIHYSGRS